MGWHDVCEGVSRHRASHSGLPTLEGVFMYHCKGAALLAASALFAFAGLVRAAEPQAPTAPDFGLSLVDKPVYLDDTAPADTSLMGLANRAGVDKTLTNYGLT